MLNIALVFQLGIGYIFAYGHEVELIKLEELMAQAANPCDPPPPKCPPHNWNKGIVREYVTCTGLGCGAQLIVYDMSCKDCPYTNTITSFCGNCLI